MNYSKINEIWKPIKGYENFYEISSFGRIKSLDRLTNNSYGTFIRKGKLLKTGIDRNGYNLTIGGEGASLNYKIKVKLNEKQKHFISYIEKENSKPIDVNDHTSMVKMVLINLVHCYLISDNQKDKKESARLLIKLKTNLLEAVLKTGVIDKKELNSWLA